MKKRKFPEEAVFGALVELYRHKKSALKKLEHVRLNPDFKAREHHQNNCLEFFIPQVCSFFLQNNLGPELQGQLVELITEACKCNFFFAHKVWFFFNSNLGIRDPETGNLDENLSYVCRDMLDRIEDVMLSSEFELYLANEDQILKLSSNIPRPFNEAQTPF